MSHIYNQVTPLSLGSSSKKKENPFIPTTNGSNDNNNQLSTLENSHTANSSSTSLSDGLLSGTTMGYNEEMERRRKRAQRFNNNNNNSNDNGSKPPAKKVRNTFDTIQDEEDYSNLNAISTKSHKYDKNKAIIGKCTTLEKSYLRLTSEPNPEFVRPLNILRQAFTLITNKYQKKAANYTYVCDQFKSIRQDLRVQMIENKFTVKVYETHARLALENDDLGEFNQCQSRLLTLFELPTIKKSCYDEFVSYLVLYYILTDDMSAITSLRLNLLMNSPEIIKNPRVIKTFQLANAKLTDDYHNFMLLSKSITGLGQHLIKAFIEKERLKALMIMCSSYNQIGLEFLKDEFKFNDMNETMRYFSDKNLQRFIITKNESQPNEFKYLDTRACRPTLLQIYERSRKVDIKGQK